MVFVMISVISDAPIDKTYCVVSKNKLNKTTTSAFVPNFIFSKVFDRRNPKGIKTEYSGLKRPGYRGSGTIVPQQ